MKLVIDANIIFSLLIKEGKTAELFLNFSLDLYAPEFLFFEIEKHKDEILRKTKRNPEDFNNFLGILKNIIQVITNEETLDYLEQARLICPDKMTLNILHLP